MDANSCEQENNVVLADLIRSIDKIEAKCDELSRTLFGIPFKEFIDAAPEETDKEE